MVMSNENIGGVRRVRRVSARTTDLVLHERAANRVSTAPASEDKTCTPGGSIPAWHRTLRRWIPLLNEYL